MELLVGNSTFLSVEFRLDQVTLLASGVANALFHDISLPSSSQGSRLLGTVPLPIDKGGIGLNLNKIDTDGMTLSKMISFHTHTKREGERERERERKKEKRVRS
jgi:hypothetical protein